MKTLYFDCSMGAAGDMLTAALLELIPNPSSFIDKLNSIGIENVRYIREEAKSCGIKGTHIKVEINGEEESEDMHSHHHHHHHHASLHDIEHIVSHLTVPESIKYNVINIYKIIAEAESKAHGMPVTEIHFHEVGTMDSIADVTAVCMLIDEIKPDAILASPIHVGSGSVKCAHGILPVPVPAVVNILTDVPIYSGEIKTELCTPTGAALLKYFVSSFGDMPSMSVKSIGYGMGKKEFERANCVRAIIGETEDKKNDTIIELKSNIDDMTAEAIAYAAEKILKAGAADVTIIPAIMKKGRPGYILCVMCKEEIKNDIVKEIFRHTSTIGIRETLCNRYVLTRSEEKADTKFGTLRKKISSGYGVTKTKFEYDDLKKAADDNDMSIEEILAEIDR